MPQRIGHFITDATGFLCLFPDNMHEVGGPEDCPGLGGDESFPDASLQEDIKPLSDFLGNRNLPDTIAGLGCVLLSIPDNGVLHLDVVRVDVVLLQAGNLRVDHPCKDHKLYNRLIPGVEVLEKFQPFIEAETFPPLCLSFGEMLPDVAERIV